MSKPQRCTATGCYGCTQFAEIHGGGWRCVECKTVYTETDGGLRYAAQFLSDRLETFEHCLTSDEDARQFFGHVTPALQRLRAILAPENLK